MTQASSVPSGSAESQRLLQLCQTVAEGAADKLPELIEAVEKRQHECTGAFAAFTQQVQEQPPEFRAQMKANIEDIEQQFASYSEALEAIHDYKDHQDLARLTEAAGNLAYAAYGLQMSTRRYEETLLSQGPSPFPIVNLFENTGRGYLGGQMPQEYWASSCQAYRHYYQGALEELDGSSHKDRTGIAERRAAFASIVDCLGRLEGLSPGSPPEQLDALISQLSQSHGELHTAMRVYNENQFAQGPTASPPANWLINTANALLARQLAPGIVIEYGDRYLAHVRKSVSDIKTAMRAPTESAVLNEEAPKMLEAGEAIEDAILEIRRFAEECQQAGDLPEDVSAVRACLEQIQSAVAMLALAEKHVGEFNEHAGRVMCPHCQAYNPPNSRNCEKCRRPLPQLSLEGARSSFQVVEGAAAVGAGAAQGPVITTKMKALFDACESFSKGSLSGQELSAVLEAEVHLVEKAEQELSGLAVPSVPDEADEEDREICEEYLELAQDAIDLLNVGAEECRQALEKLREAVAQQPPGDLREGMQLYFDGIQKMYQVRRVDAAFQAALKAAFEARQEAMGEEVQRRDAEIDTDESVTLT